MSQDEIETWPRPLSEYQLIINGNIIYLYSCHLKSSQGSDNQAYRLASVTALREHLGTLPENSEFIIGGDMNIYTNSEDAYQKFIADETDNSGRSRDLSNNVGSWHDNYTYREIHTQSTREYQFGGGVGGGLDDRFDFLFANFNINNNLGVEYVEESIVSYGNDGEHFNQSINDGNNSAVPDDVADALFYASDHLPAYADFISIDNDIITISDIQITPDEQEGDSPLLGQTVQIWGIVSAITENGYFIQDDFGAWNGIFVHDYSNSPSLGDNISVVGVVIEYYEKTEISEVSSYALNSSNNNIYDAINISTNEINQEMYEGVLVKVTNAECINNDVGYGEWLINDSSGDAIVDDLMFGFSSNIGAIYDITGVVDYSFSNFKLEPRFESDIVPNSIGSKPKNSTQQIQLDIFPNPFNSKITFSIDSNLVNNSLLKIFNINGQLIETLKADRELCWDASNCASGIYFVHLVQNSKDIEIKRIVYLK